MMAEFNLLDEDWIKVLCQDYTVKEVSLMEVLIHAHNYRDLAGELKAQDIAVLRLLLAVLHTVFSRVDLNGDCSEIEEESEALERWLELWDEKQFPEKPIRQYIEKYRNRFYLFHEEYPFYQVPEAAKGTWYKASKLNGELSESSNKLRLFPSRTGELREIITYAEASRWLLYINGYDDTSSKPKEKGLPSPGVGWLGKLGIVSAAGDNLFQTLMLNLTFLQDGNKVWEKDCPVWELPQPHKEERKEIAVPDNLAEILTLQSRRLLLNKKEDKVTGYYLLGGDFFQKENAFAEQMTVWREIKDKRAGIVGFQPKRHDSNRQMWRDFASLVVRENDRHIPGVVSWVARLYEEEMLPEEAVVNFRITSVQYGDKDFFITDEFGDSLSFAASLLVDKGKIWQELIVEEIARCDKRGFYIGNFAKNLVKAEGGDEKEQDAQCKNAREEFFYQLDIPFRRWLVSLEPWQGPEIRDERRKEWNDKASAIARKLGSDMADRAGLGAFVGRNIEEAGKVRHYSTSEALNWFMGQINKIDKEG